MNFFKRYARNYGALIGLAILLVVMVLAFAAPLLFPVSPWQSVGDPLLPPSEDPAFPFGTDMLGRDIAAGLAYGARVSLLIGVISTAVAVVIGVTIGALAGFYGGRVDDLLMRFTEFFQTIPAFAMAVVLVAISPIIVTASLMVATAILTESSLSFLGLGDRNMMSWGFMIGAARTMLREAWWMSVFPGVAILLTVLAINLIGEGLNDAMNPHLRGRKG